jgi:hypothetical protein
MPVKIGIQKSLGFLDSGSRQVQPEADPSFGRYLRLARKDD